MIKPEPLLRIPANAATRDPEHWANPDSLCRTCVYQFLQEPFCDTVKREGRGGTTKCSGYELETMVSYE
jgi:hypothetical protein